ncbi:MAG: DegV family protein [Anaerolineales bacterium]|nr:DegV family protein [Anaerolineales bacterium]
MPGLKIVTDSTCDLPLDIVKELDIRVIPLFINIGKKGYLDGVDITREEFYNGLPAFNPPPKTATPGMEVFRKVYQELAEEGAEEILSIHISESLSATVNVARAAAEEYTQIPVHVLDSDQLSLGMGFLVEMSARAARMGKRFEDIKEQLKDQISRSHVFAAIDTLEYLRRGGRMNSVIAGIGTLIRMKPILKMHAGVPSSEQVRTSNGAYKRLLELLYEKMPLEKIALVHTHADDKARELLAKVKRQLPEGPIISVDITPVLGAHLGPGAIGFACVSARESD